MAAQQPARASPELRKAPLSPRYLRNYTTSGDTNPFRDFQQYSPDPAPFRPDTQPGQCRNAGDLAFVRFQYDTV